MFCRKPKKESKRIKTAADNDYRERRAEVQRQENRLNQKSETLDHKLEGVEQRERNMNNREKEIETVKSRGYRAERQAA